MLIVRTPVRISFGGGGTDLPAYSDTYGGAVLSTAIDKYFYTVLRKRDDGKIQVISSDLRVCETWDDLQRMSIEVSGLDIPLAVIKHVSQMPGLAGRNIAVDLFMASEIPPGTGLGSSASVCVNVLKAVTSYLRIPMSPYQIAEQAFQIARNVLGKPVGRQDEYAAAFGGLNYITFARDGSAAVDPVKIEPEVMRELKSNLMLFFTGAAHHSWSILRDQESSTRKVSSTAVESLHQIRELSVRMHKALVAGDLHAFGLMLDEGWQAKKLLSDKISTSRIDELYHVARKSGAIGGKITGAGGGGFLLLYCEEQKQPAVREALLHYGLREMRFDFDSQGAQVIVNDPFIDNDEIAGNTWQFVPVSTAPAKRPRPQSA